LTDQPWVESEGVPEMRHYWGPYSKREGLNAYINVVLYSEDQKRIQIQLRDTREFMDRYNGFIILFSSVDPWQPGANVDLARV